MLKLSSERVQDIINITHFVSLIFEDIRCDRSGFRNGAIYVSFPSMCGSRYSTFRFVLEKANTTLDSLSFRKFLIRNLRVLVAVLAAVRTKWSVIFREIIFLPRQRDPFGPIL